MEHLAKDLPRKLRRKPELKLDLFVLLTSFVVVFLLLLIETWLQNQAIRQLSFFLVALAM